MSKILISVLVSFFIFNAQITKAEAPPAPEILSVEDMVTKYARLNGVSIDLAHYIAKNESHYQFDAKGDLNLICKNPRSPWNGTSVYARGVYQLTRCYHPEISDAEAFNPESNIKIAMAIIGKSKESCINEFSTCREYYEKER